MGGDNTNPDSQSKEKSTSSDGALRSGRVVAHPASKYVETDFSRNRSRIAPISK